MGVARIQNPRGGFCMFPKSLFREIMINKETIKKPFWAMSAEETVTALMSSENGLSEKESEERLKIFGKNEITGDRLLA